MPPKRQQRYMKRCGRPGCKNTFGPGTRGALGLKQFCSPACGRVRRNSRTREILRLADADFTTPQIAAIVETTTQWVRWVRARDRNAPE